MARSPDFDPRKYWEERLAARCSLAGVGHAGFPLSYNRWLYRIRRAVFRRVIRGLDIDVPSARVLDIGSGTGFYVKLWKAAGAADVEGVDIAPTSVEFLCRRFPGSTFRQGDIGDPGALAGLEGSFDVVSAMDVLFHLVEDSAYARAIRNVHSALKEGGIFIFSDNFLHGPERRGRHIVHRRLTRVRALLDESGFEILERRSMFVIMAMPVDTSARSVLRAWAAISRAARTSELMGWVTGAMLYPLELTLTALRRESPTTEIMVCRRKPRRKSA